MRATEDERWAEVPGVPGYWASTEGRIRSPRGRILTGTPYKWGHRSVHIYFDGRRTHRLIHRLVLLTFVGPPPDGHECRHLDGDPSNNRLTNLRWGTHSENMQDRLRHGTNPEAVKTHCKRNHEFTPENTYTRTDNGARQCRACNRERDRARQRRAP